MRTSAAPVAESRDTLCSRMPNASITSSNFGRVSIRANNSKSNTIGLRFISAVCAATSALRVAETRKAGSAVSPPRTADEILKVPTPTRAKTAVQRRSETRHTEREETTGTQLHGANRRDARPLCSGCLQSPVYVEYRARRSTRNAAVTAATAARACATLGEASKSKSGLM